MGAFINTNISSLNAQRNLNSSQSALQTSLQRLSSGLRINSAKDDAAGLAITQRMTSQINGLDQAARNANDGISMAQTAEGALSTTTDILQRIRELAVQSSNASNSASDRQALQQEVGQLTTELNRIATTTNFNGQNLLDGTTGTLNFQVGANSGQTISASGVNFLTQNYGNNNLRQNEVDVAADNTGRAANDIVVAGYLGSATYTTTGTGETAQSIAAGINRLTSQTGVTASAKTEANLTLDGESYNFTIASDNSSPITVSFTVGGSGTTASDYASALSAINAQTAKTGVTAEFDQTNGGIKLTNASGNDINIVNTASADNTKFDIKAYNTDGTLGTLYDAKVAATTALVSGQVQFDSQQSFSVSDAGSGFGVGAAASATTTQASSLQSVASIDVTTFDNAQSAINIVDAALNAVNGQRAQYGALQSRFQSIVSNLQTASENLSASRSRIQDTDFAAETANLTRAQILQQAGTAMLAQANSLPNNVLTLLRGG
jgi:flagellin